MKILNRAKSIHSGYYPIGEWLEHEGRCFIIETEQLVGFEVNSHSETFDDGMLDGEINIQDFIYEVHENTRALNFENMTDSEDNKIFASLQEDGQGGDIVEVLDCEDADYVAWYNNHSFKMQVLNINPEKGDWETDSLDGCDVKVIGIKA